MSRLHALALTGAFVLLMTTLAEAQQPPYGFFPIDRTFNNLAFANGGGSAIIGYEKLQTGTLNTFENESSPTITFNGRPAIVPLSFASWHVYNGSTLISNDALLGNVTTYNISTLIAQNNGRVGQVVMNQTSKFIFNSGFATSVTARNFSNLTMSGGQIGDGTTLSFLRTMHTATAVVTNGRIFGSANAGDGSRIDLVASYVRSGVNASGTARVTVLTSQLDEGAAAAGTSQISIDESILDGSVTASNNSFVGVNHSSISGVVAAGGTATIGITGGVSIAGAVAAEDGSSILLAGNSSAGEVRAIDKSTVLVEDSLVKGNATAVDMATLNLDAGLIEGDVFAHGDSHINISGKSFVDFQVFAYDSSVITIADGYVEGNVYAIYKASVFVTGGRVNGRLQGLEDGEIFLSGGSVFEAIAVDASSIVMSDGEIDANLIADGAGTATMFGGEVGGNIVVQDYGVVNMAGGHVAGTLQLSGNGVFNYSGGTISQGVPPLPGGGGSLSPLSEVASAGQGAGGMLSPGLIGYDNSTINLFGPNLEATLVDPNFEGMFSVYEMKGKLADGTPIGGEFVYLQNETGASFHLFLVPEPGGFAVASIALIGGLLRRRKKW